MRSFRNVKTTNREGDGWKAERFAEDMKGMRTGAILVCSSSPTPRISPLTSRAVLPPTPPHPPVEVKRGELNRAHGVLCAEKKEHAGGRGRGRDRGGGEGRSGKLVAR